MICYQKIYAHKNNYNTIFTTIYARLNNNYFIFFPARFQVFLPSAQ